MIVSSFIYAETEKQKAEAEKEKVVELAPSAVLENWFTFYGILDNETKWFDNIGLRIGCCVE